MAAIAPHVCVTTYNMNFSKDIVPFSNIAVLVAGLKCPPDVTTPMNMTPVYTNPVMIAIVYSGYFVDIK